MKKLFLLIILFSLCHLNNRAQTFLNKNALLNLYNFPAKNKWVKAAYASKLNNFISFITEFNLNVRKFPG